MKSTPWVKLDDFGDKLAAIDRAYEYMHDGYFVVVLQTENDACDEIRYIIWGTKAATMFTGGWNR